MNRKNIYFIILVLLLFIFLFFKKNKNQDSLVHLPTHIENIETNQSKTQNPLVEKSKSTEVKSEIYYKDSVVLNQKQKDHTLTETEINKLRSAAKIFMASSYAAQLSFFIENNYYTTDLVATGLITDEQLSFKAGFLEPSNTNTNDNPKINPQQMTTDAFIGRKGVGNEGEINYRSFVSEVDLSSYKNFCQRGCSANESGFEMMIAVPLGNSNQIDVWLVNEKKEFILVQDGTKVQP